MAIADLFKGSLRFADTSLPPTAGKLCPCLLCGKSFIMRIYTGEPDQVCSECWDKYKDCARLVCVRCKVTICRVEPKVLDNGFYVRPRSVLHTNACNICKPGLLQSDVIEIREWERCVRPGKIIMVGK